jgi:hypothetical protein
VRLEEADVTSTLTTLGLSEARVSSTTRLSWLGSNPYAQPRGLNRQPGVSNYLLGKDPRKWQRHVSHYDRVQLRDLYPGIDLTYYGNQQRVEFDYAIAPHADPKSIQVGISGPSIVSLDAGGRLSISSAGDEMLLLPPVAFQEKNGKRSTVAAHYVLFDRNGSVRSRALHDVDPDRNKIKPVQNHKGPGDIPAWPFFLEGTFWL